MRRELLLPPQLFCLHSIIITTTTTIIIIAGVITEIGISIAQLPVNPDESDDLDMGSGGFWDKLFILILTTLGESEGTLAWNNSSGCFWRGTNTLPAVIPTIPHIHIP